MSKDTTPHTNPPPTPVEQDTEAELLKKVLEYKELSQRLAADYHNLQKDTQQRLQDIRKYATEELLQEICPLVDYFDSAFAAIPVTDQAQPWLKGVKHIQDYLLKILRDHNVVMMETIGQPFNPHLHEAIGEEVTADQPEGNVVRQNQAGFLLNDKMIRPAKVIVAKAPNNPASNNLII